MVPNQEFLCSHSESNNAIGILKQKHESVYETFIMPRDCFIENNHLT